MEIKVVGVRSTDPKSNGGGRRESHACGTMPRSVDLQDGSDGGRSGAIRKLRCWNRWGEPVDVRLTRSDGRIRQAASPA